MLTISEQNSVAVLQLDRAPVNALNMQFVEAIEKARVQACSEGASAIVIAGREGLFSAGLDVPELLGQDRAYVQQFWQAFFLLMNGIASSPVPVIAAITGHAPAGGAVLALHCDYRVAACGDFVMGLNEVRVGLPVPPNILFMLESVVGSRQAALLATTGAMLSPEKALEVGLVDELVEPEEVVAAAVGWASQLLKLPREAMNTTRLAAKAELIERARDNKRFAATATDYWFAEETQQMMRKLVDELGSKTD